MTREEKKLWLDRYRQELCRAKLIESELREARAAALPGSPGLDGMPRGHGNGSIVERAILDVARLENELRAALDEAGRIREEILAVIAGLPATEYGIVRKRHLDPRCPWRGATWQQVADSVYMSEGRTKHLYGEILDRLEIPVI